MTARGLLVGGLVLLAACSGGGNGGGVEGVDLAVVPGPGPTHSMAALVEGDLVLDQGCVVLEWTIDVAPPETGPGVQRALALWPPGTEASGSTDDLVITVGGVDLPVGGPGRGYGGGFLSESDDPAAIPDQVAGIDALATCAERLSTGTVFQMAGDQAT